MKRPSLLETRYARAILLGLQDRPHVNQRTVPPVEIHRRSAAAKRARIARRVNR